MGLVINTPDNSLVVPGGSVRPRPSVDVGYAARPMPGLDERRMAVEPGAVLDDGVEFTHEYDFGTTTESSVRVVERDDHHCGLGVTADYGDAPVRLLARNEMPDVCSGVCSDEATAVCTAHTYDENGLPL